MVYHSKMLGRSTRKRRSNDAASPHYGDGNGGDRYAETRRNYPWKNRSEGRKGLVAIYMYCRACGSDDQFLHHPPGELGVTGSALLHYLHTNLPALFDDHRLVCGKELDPKKVMSRIGNMWRNNGRRNFEQGSEHPKNHPILKPILDKWDEALMKNPLVLLKDI